MTPMLVRAVRIALLAAAFASPPAARSFAARGPSWDPVELVEGVAPVVVEVKGRPRVYFPITAPAPLKVSLTGPARLRVVSRAEVAAGSSAPVSYSVRVDSDGKSIGEVTTTSSPAPGAKRKDGQGAICKSRTLLVEIPAGPHGVTIRTEGAASVLVRLLVASPQRPREARMISLTPVDARRSVTVVEGEKMIPYYTTRVGSPVRFRVIGPTKVELSSRLDFDATMRGSQHYRLALRVSGAAAREESFTTTKALGATYMEAKDRIPSKLDRAVVAVAEGSHDVVVELLGPKSGTAQVRLRIPQPSVGNEE